MSNMISKSLIQTVSLSRQHLHSRSLAFPVYHTYHCLSLTCLDLFPVRNLKPNSVLDIHKVLMEVVYHFLSEKIS